MTLLNRRLTLLATAALLMAVGPASHLLAVVTAKPDFNGSYEVIVQGDWKGRGKITIGSKNVNFRITATDENGNDVSLHCPGMDMDDAGRFHGEGDVDGRLVKISGRVDDALGKGKARILGSILDKTNRECARFVGSNKGGS